MTALELAKRLMALPDDALHAEVVIRRSGSVRTLTPLGVSVDRDKYSPNHETFIMCVWTESA